MEELLEYRQRFLDTLAAAPEELQAAAKAVRDPSKPLEGSNWNLHQIVFHMRDVNEHVYLPRLRRIIHEDDPTFENFDADDWMAAHYKPHESLKTILAGFARQCIGTAEWLRGLPSDAWSRCGTHPSLGTHTFQWWAERALAHIHEHLATMKGGA